MPDDTKDKGPFIAASKPLDDGTLSRRKILLERRSHKPSSRSSLQLLRGANPTSSLFGPAVQSVK